MLSQLAACKEEIKAKTATADNVQSARNLITPPDWLVVT